MINLHTSSDSEKVKKIQPFISNKYNEWYADQVAKQLNGMDWNGMELNPQDQVSFNTSSPYLKKNYLFLRIRIFTM